MVMMMMAEERRRVEEDEDPTWRMIADRGSTLRVSPWFATDQLVAASSWDERGDISRTRAPEAITNQGNIRDPNGLQMRGLVFVMRGKTLRL